MHIILLCQPHFSEAGETEYRILEDTAPSSLTNRHCTRAFPSPSDGSSGRRLPCRSACDTPAESKSRPPSHTSGATERVPGTGVISCGLAYHRDPNSASAETAGPAAAPGQAWEFIHRLHAWLLSTRVHRATSRMGTQTDGSLAAAPFYLPGCWDRPTLCLGGSHNTQSSCDGRL